MKVERLRFIEEYIKNKGKPPQIEEMQKKYKTRKVTLFQEIESVKNRLQVDKNSIVFDIPFMIREMIEDNYYDAKHGVIKEVVLKDGSIVNVKDENLRQSARKNVESGCLAAIKIMQELNLISKVPELIETYNQSVTMNVEAEQMREIYERIKSKRSNGNGDSK